LARGFEYAAHRIGEADATHLVVTRPKGILANQSPSELPLPAGGIKRDIDKGQRSPMRIMPSGNRTAGTFTNRLRRLFE
jgi:hypothetical protein